MSFITSVKNTVNKLRSEHTFFFHGMVAVFILYFVLWLWTISLSHQQILNRENPANILPVVGSDAVEYKELAENILYNSTFKTYGGDLETFRTPGYPLFIAAILVVHKNYFTVTFVQIFLTLFSSVILYALILKHFNKKTATLVALIFSLEVTVVTHTLIIMSDMLFVMLFLVTVYLLFGTNHPGTKTMLLTGVLLAGATLVRPIAFFSPVILISFLIWQYRNPVERRWIIRSVGLFLIAFILVLTTWLVRNERISGHSKLSSLSAYNLFHYNVPEYIATKEGIDVSEAREQFESQISPEAKNNQRSLIHSSELSKVTTPFLREHFISYIFFHIFKTIPFFLASGTETTIDIYNSLFAADTNIQIVQQNLTSLLLHGNISGTIQALKQNIVVTIEQLVWALSLLFATVAVIVHREKIFVWLAVVLILYFAVLTGPVSYSRYRIPAEPFLISLAMLGLLECIYRVVDIFRRNRHHTGT
jgi:4-amino-4-deoxy-L-arabinose transferase-like glycosyltransferase